uniref:Cancer-related nucleoside-triphosphatase homolog n=1 Tax=Phallusia mammillata TaxID=59560 RepID=A0A6F9DLZ5_9ASCI|nr:cancer-related nucleoside-triphosphatase homolog [Phallusia mammillata]
MEFRHVFLTGPPGVGKTTLIRKSTDAIKGQFPLNGFYTEEIRLRGQRIGFDAVSVANSLRCPLARIEEDVTFRKRPKVGKYSVYVNEFEDFVVPIFESCTPKSIFVLDEVGKMELFSKTFQTKVTAILKRKDVTTLGTIPIKRGGGIPFVEYIRTLPNVKVFDITVENRDNILPGIVSTLCNKTV